MEVEQPLAQQISRGMLAMGSATKVNSGAHQEDELTLRPKLDESSRSKSDQVLPIDNPLEDSPLRTEGPRNHTSKYDQQLLSLEATTELFRTKIEDANRDTEHALAGSEEVSDVVKPKLTLDLGHSYISRLPEAVVDLIKAEVERLSLSHNQIWHIPLRFSECSHLRYLNIRSNVFREIPRGVYKLPLLEILDVSRNKVRKIPKDICNLTSLRVFSIVHNRIDDLPTEMCEMTNLKILKISENPLRVRLKKVVEQKEAELAYADMTDNERDLAMTAEIQKHLREQYPVPAVTSAEPDSTTSTDEAASDVPKPLKRVMSSRFPVVPSGQSMDGMTESSRSSPIQVGRPAPPIPTRSHYRVASGQLNNQRRASLISTINGNERNRSNSEGLPQAGGTTRPRRMGLLRKEKSDLDSIDETKVIRQTHLRGFSYASALRRNSAISSPVIGTSSPSSPREARTPMTPSMKRLSCLPEHKSEATVNPIIEGAKGLLYSLHQIEIQIRGLVSVVKNDDSKRTSLELTFYNASKWTKRLNKALENVDFVDFEDTEASEKAQDAIQQLCYDCVMTYKHVVAQLQDNTRNIVSGTDPRYVRTLILLLFGSIVEVKNALKTLGVEFSGHRRQMSSGNTNPIQTIPEEFATPQQQLPANTPIRDRNATQKQAGRLRSDTAIQHPTTENPPVLQPVQPVLPPSSARLPPSMQLPISTMNGAAYNNSASAYLNGNTYGVRSRSNSRNAFSSTSGSSVADTPRSGEGFHLPPPSSLANRVNPATGMTDAQEESHFEEIYLALTKSYDAALQAVPYARKQFLRCLEVAEENRRSKDTTALWHGLIRRCKSCQDMSEALQIRLTNMHIKDAGYGTLNTGGGRNDPSFWLLCKTFLQSFVDLVTDMREAKDMRVLPSEIMMVLRPVHKASRDAGRLIEGSPWRHLTDGVTTMPAPTPYTPAGTSSSIPAQQAVSFGNGINGGLSAYSSSLTHHQIQQSLHSGQSPSTRASAVFTPVSAVSAPSLQLPIAAINGLGPANGTSPTVQLPATPLSAALGPAVQATIPSTPASAIGNEFFRGDVFQRADSLMSMPSAGGSVNFLPRR